MPSVTPLFTKRDPATGAVLFDFTGHIHAQGLDLDTGNSGNPPDANRLRWLRADGSYSAQLYSVDFLGTRLFLESRGVGASSSIFLESPSPAAVASVSVNAAKGAVSVSKTLLDSDGKSDFLYKPIWIAPTSVVVDGDVARAWTSHDVSASVPAGAAHAILNVSIGGVVNAQPAYQFSTYDFRETAAAPNRATVSFKFANAVASNIGGGIIEQIIIPLDTSGGLRRFQSQKTKGAMSSTNGSVDLVGYA